MAFKQVGIRAIIKDYGKFIKNVTGMGDATDKLTARIKKQATSWNNLNDRMDENVLKIRRMEKAIKSYGDAIVAAAGKATPEKFSKMLDNLDRMEARLKTSKSGLEKMGAGSDELGIKIDELVDKGNGLNSVLSSLAVVSPKLGKALSTLASIFPKLGSALAGISMTVPQVAAVLAAATFQLALFAFGMKAAIKTIKLGILSWKILIGTIVKVAVAIGSTLVSALKFVIPVIAKVVKGLGTALVSAAKSAISFLGKLVISIKNIASSILSFLLSPLKKAVDGITNFFRRAGQIAVGILFAQTIRKMGSALKDFANLAVEGAEKFQVLRIRLEGLVANEIRGANTTLDFADALDMAIKPAADVLNWIQRLAVASPFTSKDIGDTVAFSMAMGFTADKAKTMTEAIGNFTAGMGLSTETMERIVLQFGQMTAAGKLMGTELRDLARGAFVPINDILERVAAKLDTTATAWRELAATGQTDLAPFFDEFINMAQERFPNAMERMNNTMLAVRQNISDFVTEFLGVKTLGPAIDTISSRISFMLGSMMSDKVMYSFEQVGKSLDALVKKLFKISDAISDAVFGEGGIESAAIQVSAFVSVVIDAITDALDIPTKEIGGFVDDLKNTARDAFDWGANIMISLAEGIVKGATFALQAAMKFVGAILSKWLKGSSPPLVAPDLPIWGKKALTEWLKGFALADFDVLTAIQGPLRGALDALAGAGKIDDAGKSYAKISRKLIEGIATGKPISFFEKILKGTKEFKNELLSLVSAELAYQKAVVAAAAAQERLNAANKKFSDQTMKIRQLTQEYNAILKAGGGDLKGKLAEIQAAQRARDEAQTQIGVEEEGVAVAEEAVATASDRVELQDQLLQQLINISSAQADVGTSAKSMADKVGSAVEDMEDKIRDLGGDFSAFENEIPGLGEAFEQAKKDIQESLGALFAPLKERWMADVVPALEELKQAFTDAFITKVPTGGYEKELMKPEEGLVGGDVYKIVPTFDNTFGGTIGNAIKKAFEDVKTWWDTAKPLDFIISGFNSIKAWWEINGETITSAIGTVIGAIVSLSAQLSPGSVGAPPWAAWTGQQAQGPKTFTLADAFTNLKTKSEEWAAGLISDAAGVVAALTVSFNTFKDGVAPLYTAGIENINESVDILMEVFGIGTVPEDGGDAITLRGILKSINFILAAIGLWFLGFSQKVEKYAEGIQTIADAFSNLAAALKDVADQWARAKGATGPGGGGGGAGYGGVDGDPETPEQDGNWRIPYDNYRARLHKNEMVITAALAPSVRAFLSSASNTAVARVPAVSAFPVSAPVNKSVNFNGGINVNSGMDAAAAQHWLGKAVVGAMS